METVYVLTARQLIDLFGNSESILNEVLKSGELRCFDYEPIDSPYRKPCQIARDRDTCDMRTYVIKGRDDLSAAVIKHNNGWYEGIEMTNAQEIVDSSVDVERRRVLIIYRVAGGDNDRRPPIICSLWRYYLQMRKKYKMKLRDLDKDDTYNRRVFGCMEKMFKVVANSLYGYLNYKHSIVYSPQVAAAVTLLSRKTFYETDWLCTRAFPSLMSLRSSLYSTVVESDTCYGVKRDLCVLYPEKFVPGERVIYTVCDETEESCDLTQERFLAIRERLTNLLNDDSIAEITIHHHDSVECEIIYRDTDGAIMFFSKRNTTDGSLRAIEDTEQLAYEKIIVRLDVSTRRFNVTIIALFLWISKIPTLPCVLSWEKRNIGRHWLSPINSSRKVLKKMRNHS